MSTEQNRDDLGGWEARLVSKAGDVARTGDRWFVSMAQDVAEVGRWARREVDVIGDSMAAALDTTVGVAKKIRSARPAEEPEDGGAPSTSQLDLLVAEPASNIGASELVSHPAGVEPLLSALHQVVVNRTGGSEPLDTDPRFWALVDLIHGLAARPGVPPSNRDDTKEGSE